MLLLISPAKTLDETPLKRNIEASQPRFMLEAAELVQLLRGYDAEGLSKLMGISDKLAELNLTRYQGFTETLNSNNAKPAIFSFKGDVYVPIRVEDYHKAQLSFLSTHLRILSGLYGLLRPLDWLYPYRLEMGTRLTNANGKSLYEFWGDKVTHAITQDAAAIGAEAVLNLASSEYSKVVQHKKLNLPYITIDFKENQQGKLKTIGIHAKKARGMMVDFITREGITAVQHVKAFEDAGYAYDASLSDERTLVFVR